MMNNNIDFYHLAELSAYKLYQTPTRSEPTLRRQLFIKNILSLSCNILLENQSIREEESWLDSCFNELEDEEMEEEEESLLVMAVPFDYVTPSSHHQKDTFFLM